MTMRKIRIILLGCLMPLLTHAQTQDATNIRALVTSYKTDPRGPFEAIRWFCPDGSILPPQQRCTQPGGIQHGLLKTAVRNLAQRQGIYIGQVLAGTPHADFLDAGDGFSRLLQYQVEQYLQSVDDGWIFRRARYYRGAFQAEDEENWGKNFLLWMVAQDALVKDHFYLLRQAARHIPHRAKDDRLAEIRLLARIISDELPGFLEIRIKIHGQPDSEDLDAVRNFYNRNRAKLTEDMDAKFRRLVSELELAYKPFDFKSFEAYRDGLPANSGARTAIQRLMDRYQESEGTSPQRFEDLADALWTLRQGFPGLPAAGRLTALDASIEIERLLYKDAYIWKPAKLGEMIKKTHALAMASVGAGYLEFWEWEEIHSRIHPPGIGGEISLELMTELANGARRLVEWGSGMALAVYQPAVEIFSAFEPLAGGFIDEQVRASILLPLGDTAGELREFTVKKTGIGNRVLGLRNPSGFYGLNPGYALGELVVLGGDNVPGDFLFSPEKIYVLPVAPPDLKPVAGILTASEGNLVSHVQLLARNLGIPNAVLSRQNIGDLAAFNGRRVFLAVSPGGVVLMKHANELTASERELVETRSRPDEKVRVPVQRLDLENTRLSRLSELRALDSGRIVGPKAANLGQLKSMFSDCVGEGLIVPFGVFRQHLQQAMPESGQSYWEFIQETFLPTHSGPDTGVQSEERILDRLKKLREAIRSIPFLPEFEQDLGTQFAETFGAPVGRVPVFIRSDTNMEDLKDFTGAGLNLTVFNVVDADRILQGIRDVWASPYSERSYRWRQKYLMNPENVYPSILILPTVDVEKSGVLITTGIVSQNAEDTTIAFNRGAGGAVEGQRAETYLIRSDGSALLLNPVRETRYTTLPATGGSSKSLSSFAEPVLSDRELDLLHSMSRNIRNRLPGMPGMESPGPYDVELGFKNGSIVLFQVRPFVENNRAKSSLYLRSLDSRPPESIRVSLEENLYPEDSK